MITTEQILQYFENRNFAVKRSESNNVQIITGGKNISEAGTSEITFLGKKYLSQAADLLAQCKAGIVILDKDIFENIALTSYPFHVVVADDPKHEMVDCLTNFFLTAPIPGIHPTSIIHPSAKTGAHCLISAYVIIEENVVIGDHCILDPYVHIMKDTIIGNHVHLKTGAVVGGGGFGYAKQQNGTWKHFPHFGNVVIEDYVSIGSHTCIDRGALGSTIIKEGAKIDNLVHIAHNVVVGKNSLVIANAMIGGSTVIGDNCWVAPSVSLKNGITIGNDATIGMSAVVLKNVEPGAVMIGNPAKPLEKK
jgi:UDP-3-O-[3-hydroxymyristoyl] glucosamine N-acyltransferase